MSVCLDVNCEIAQCAPCGSARDATEQEADRGATRFKAAGDFDQSAAALVTYRPAAPAERKGAAQPRSLYDRALPGSISTSLH